MKPWIKILITGIAGFAGGFAAGFLFHKKTSDVQIEEITEEEMAEIEKAVEETRKKTEQNVSETKDIQEETEKILDEIERADGDPDKTRLAMQRKTPYIRADQEAKMAYEKLFNATKEYSNSENAEQIPTERNEEEEGEDIPSEDEFDPEFLENIEMETVEPGSNFVEPPHVISLSEFYNERPEFDKITIDWYQPDNAWIDEKQEVIADIHDYIGTTVEGLFDKNGPEDDPDVRFVRNEAYGTDYEIIRHHRSWHETIGGVD